MPKSLFKDCCFKEHKKNIKTYKFNFYSYFYMEKVLELTHKEFENFISTDLVLVDFYADWCMPCLMMAPILEELAERFENKIKFAKVNIEDSPELAKKFHISSIPNFILFKKGYIFQQFVGAISEEDFEEKLNNLI
jgi:thioredoxin 1